MRDHEHLFNEIPRQEDTWTKYAGAFIMLK